MYTTQTVGAGLKVMAALQAIDVYVGNKEPPTSVLTNILQDYLETTGDDAP
jgi:hypothetical protein